jgi:hypothetical protein
MFDRAVCLPIRITRDPWIEFAALLALRELLPDVGSQYGQSLSSNTPVLSAADEARENRGILTQRQSQRPATDHRPVHQLDLFSLLDPAGFNQPVPLWRVLPVSIVRFFGTTSWVN